MDIKALRRQLGVTQEQLAELLPTDPRTIQRWEARAMKPSQMARARLNAIVKEFSQRHQARGEGAEAAATPKRQLQAGELRT